MQRLDFSRASVLSFLGLATFAVLIPQAACQAQPPTAGGFSAAAGPAGSGNGGNAIIEFAGIYQGAVGGIMKIKRDDDTEVLVQLPSDPSELHFRGKPDPQMIQPGLTVRFQADFGPAGLPTAPVSSIEIIRPINAPGMSRAAKESLTPGVYPLQPQPGNRRPPVFVPGPYRIVGVLRGASKDVMMVAAGNTPVQTQVAEDVEFTVHFNTLELAQPGDQVKVKGFYQPPDDTRVRAATVEVSTDRVIGEERAKPKRRGRRGRKNAEAETPPAKANAVEGNGEAADDPFAPLPGTGQE